MGQGKGVASSHQCSQSTFSDCFGSSRPWSRIPVPFPLERLDALLGGKSSLQDTWKTQWYSEERASTLSRVEDAGENRQAQEEELLVWLLQPNSSTMNSQSYPVGSQTGCCGSSSRWKPSPEGSFWGAGSPESHHESDVLWALGVGAQNQKQEAEERPEVCP